MEIKLIVDDETDAKQLLKRLSLKDSVVWPVDLMTEKEAKIKVDISKREVRIYKATAISLPIRL